MPTSTLMCSHTTQSFNHPAGHAADRPADHPAVSAGRPVAGRVDRCGLHVGIVGGSLTGPVAALLLSRIGCTVTVYEACGTAVLDGGGVLSLEHAALAVLDRLGIDRDEYLAPGTSETIWQVHLLARAATQRIPRPYPGRFATWAGLNQALIRRLPAGTLRLGARVINLVEHHGRPQLVFTGQRPPEPVDLVVFADGRASTGRRQLDPARRCSYAGYVAFRGQGPARGLRDFTRLEPGAGAQFNVMPLSATTCDWIYYLNVPARRYAALFGRAPHGSTFIAPGSFPTGARDFIDAHAKLHLPAGFAELVRAATTRWAVPVTDTPAPSRMVWPVGTGHAVLAGDALAPVRAHAARGANNGIEQAAGLAIAVDEHHRHGADLTAALRGWQRRMLPLAIDAHRRGTEVGKRLGLGTNPAPA